MSRGNNTEAALVDIAAEINSNDDSRRACEVKGVMHGFRMGQLLRNAKSILPHGDFLPWVKANTKVSARMCQLYMRVAGDPRIQQMIEAEHETVSHLTLTQAVKLATPSREAIKKADNRIAKEIGELYAKATVNNRAFAHVCGELVEGLREAGYSPDAIVMTLIEHLPVGPGFAAKIPHMVDADFNADAWFDALLDDVLDAEGDAP